MDLRRGEDAFAKSILNFMTRIAPQCIRAMHSRVLATE